ncbi:MAG: UDP-glucose dehydrogenase family protein [Labedaea sp.]
MEWQVRVRRIAVVGAGYVGLTTGACLAALGHDVVCADADPEKVKRLDRGEVGIQEPRLAGLVADGLAAGRLSFVLGAAAAVARPPRRPDVVFLCLPTPRGAGGTADLSSVVSAMAEIGELLSPGSIVVNKSTVPVGTARRLATLMRRDDVQLVSNPEFLREGRAVDDFMNPDRIVVGSDDPNAATQVAALYAGMDAPTVLTDTASAELTKYAANSFLAMKLSFVNAMAELCERLGADISDVAEGIGRDRRIGREFLSPGPGWGGSCLPKDIVALLHVADAAGVDLGLLRAAVETNSWQQRRMVEKVRLAVTGRSDGSLSRARLGLLGLTFKAGTDDTRDSPALAVADLLRRAGAWLAGYDPALAVRCDELDGIPLADDPYRVAAGTDALVVLTEWPEFRGVDWVRMARLVRRPTVVDTRNILDPDVLRSAGFRLVCVGLGSDPAT